MQRSKNYNLSVCDEYVSVLSLLATTAEKATVMAFRPIEIIMYQCVTGKDERA